MKSLDKCVRCGNNLKSPAVGWRSTIEWMEGGPLPYCVNCQQKYYSMLSANCGRAAALFYCCVAFDVPYLSSYLPNIQDVTGGIWKTYLRNLRNGMQHRDADNNPLGFADGECNIAVALNNVDVQLLNAVPPECLGPEDWTDRERWNAWWGEQYTDKECKQLDRIFDAYAADIGNGSVLPPRTEMAIIDISKLKLQLNDCLQIKGLSEKDQKEKLVAAEKLQGIIDKQLKGEALQRDDRPQDDVYIDKLVDFLENAGFVKAGKFTNMEETAKNIWRLMHGKNPKYPYTLDAVDQAMLLLLNTTADNDGKNQMSALPDDLRLNDEHGEFEKAESEQEIENRKKLGLLKMPPKNKKTKKEIPAEQEEE